MNRVTKSCFAGGLVLVLFFGTDLSADACAGGDFGILTIPVQNSTGLTANDLTVDFKYAVGDWSTAIAPPFKSRHDASGNSGSFNDGTVANKGSAAVTVETDDRNTISGGFWSNDSGPIGSFGDVSLAGTTSHSGGMGTISLINKTLEPLPYSNLFGFRDAPGAYFNTKDYLFGLEELGTPVTLLVPSSGTLAPGVTDIYTYSIGASGSAFAALSEFPYAGGIVTIGGLQYAAAESEQPAAAAVPEPSTLHLALAALVLLALARYRQRRRQASTAFS